jgi:hypothetical protein
MSIQDLKKEAKELKIKGYTKMDAAALTEAISTTKVENTRKHLDDQQKSVLTPLNSDTPPDLSLAEKTGFTLARFFLEKGGNFLGFITSRKFIFTTSTVALIGVGFYLNYLMRPEPTMLEKLMGYLPF